MILPLLVLLVQDPAERAREFQAHITKVRGLEFRREVPIGVYGREELRRFVMAEFEKQFPRARARKVEKAYAHFGLIPADLRLYDALIELYAESVAGFYHQTTREIRLIRPEESSVPDGADFSVDLSDVTLVHELTHAAQDQTYDFRTLPLEEEDDDDLVAAVKALTEGDAFACGWNFVYRRTFDRVIRIIVDRQKSARLPGKAGELPEFLRLAAVFPESYGCEFVLAALKANGGDWKALSRIYDDLPASTEQILHPEKYLERRDPPVALILPDLGESWRPIAANVHGEFAVRVMVGEKAAAGWRGDRYHLFERHGVVSSVWFSRWDSVQDAREFFDAYGRRLRERHGSGKVTAATEDRVVLSEGEAGAASLERRGTDVLALDGEAALLALAEAVWRGVRARERAKVARYRLGRWVCPKHADVERTVDATCPRCGEQLVPR
ncbi:MAG: hypothetical protein HYY17_16020 [Planctomycetes bacterium]|nr:hypothetical protein [Planctomycetota bacterium]